MDVGIQMIFSTYGWPGMSDREAWQDEIRLARLADELGFDVIWSVEHHFFDYSFCPDNTQLLSYLASLCTHVDLGTAAIILPWNDPLRVGLQSERFLKGGLEACALVRHDGLDDHHIPRVDEPG